MRARAAGVGSAAVLAVGAIGCGSAESTPRASNRAKVGFHAPAGDVTALTRRVVLLADTQFQYLHGAGIDMRTTWADLAAATAIRPPQLDMFSSALLEDACHRTTGPIIHVGDAGNGSCVGELDTMLEIFGRCRAPGEWVFAPGNHDGFFLGTSDRLCEADIWEKHCGGAGQALTKPRMVQQYLSKHLRPAYSLVTESTTVEAAGDVECARAATPGLLDRVCWRTPDDERWASFIVQQIDLSPPGTKRVRGVLLDTSQFADHPKPLPTARDAGSTGSVLDDQVEVVERWIRSAEGELFVLFGHHPLDELDGRAWARLDALISRNPTVVLYVSAHTHRGWVREHSLAGGPFIELNLASMTDPPNEVRDLQLLAHEGSVFFDSEANPGIESPECLAEWTAPAGEYLAYRSVRGLDPVGTQTKLLELQAKAWRRLIDQVGFTDEAAARRVRASLDGALRVRGPDREARLRAAVVEASRADATERVRVARDEPDPSTAERRRRYRRCMALEAGRAEKLPARRNRPREGCPKKARPDGSRACVAREIVELPLRGGA